MKTFHLIIAAALLLTNVSSTAAIYNFEHISEQHSSKTLPSSSASIKAAAYELWLNKLTELKGVSSRRLEVPLSIPLRDVESSLLLLNDGVFSPFRAERILTEK